MYNLFYTSYATYSFTQTDLENLLKTAREKNRQSDITGLLLYCEGVFVQLLEGEEEKVKSTFERISKDSRHTNISNVVFANPTQRYFPDWLMGFKSMSPDELASIDKHENTSIKEYFKTSQPYKMIKLMSRSHWNN